MRRVALKGLAFRKVRALLTALAVVLGVAMVSGTYVLTDSIQRAFDGIFTGSYDDTSAVISGKQVVEFSTTGKATVPESLLQTVRGVEGVQQAEGAIFDLQSEGNTVKLYNDEGRGGRQRPGALVRVRLRRRRRPLQPAAARRRASGPPAPRRW